MGKVEENGSVLLSDFDSQIAKIDEAKASIEQKKVLVGEMISDVASREKASFDDGYAKGVASIQLPDPSNPANLYTQQQMNDAVNAKEAEITGKLQPQIDDLSSKLGGVQAELDLAKQDVETLKAAAELDKANDAAQAQAIIDAAGKIQ